MNLIIPFAAASLLLVSLALAAETAPPPAKVCLNINDIQRTEIVDDRTILFHMYGGKIWSNRLRTACPMLKVSPYTEKLNEDLVCSNQQFIHLTLTGNDCVLGDFTPVASPP